LKLLLLLLLYTYMVLKIGEGYFVIVKRGQYDPS